MAPEPPSGSTEQIARNEAYWSTLNSFVLQAAATPMSNGYGGFTPQYILDRLKQFTDDEARAKSKLFLGRNESGSSPALRELMASPFGPIADEVTLTRNCMNGLSTLLYGFDLKRGDEVVACA